jgi:hypothetical protein
LSLDEALRTLLRRYITRLKESEEAGHNDELVSALRLRRDRLSRLVSLRHAIERRRREAAWRDEHGMYRRLEGEGQ